MLASSGDGAVRLWDTETWELKRTLAGNERRVSHGVFSPDGATLASGSGDKTVLLWDTETWKRKRTLTGHTDWISSVSFNSDGSLLASSNVTTVRLWDPETGKSKRTFTAQRMIIAVAFSPNGRTLAIVERSDAHEWPLYYWGGGDVVQLWDVVTGELKRALTVIATPDIRSIAFSSDGKTLVGGAENVLLWDVRDRADGADTRRTYAGRHERSV